MDIDIYISAYYNVSMSSDEFIRKGLLPMKNHALPFTPIKTTNISKLVMESIKQALLRPGWVSSWVCLFSQMPTPSWIPATRILQW